MSPRVLDIAAAAGGAFAGAGLVSLAVGPLDTRYLMASAGACFVGYLALGLWMGVRYGD